MTQPKLGPQEPPDDPRIFNRRQPDGSFRLMSEFFEPTVVSEIKTEQDELLAVIEKADSTIGLALAALNLERVQHSEMASRKIVDQAFEYISDVGRELKAALAEHRVHSQLTKQKG